MLQLGCVATWGRPTLRQSLYALITTPMLSLKSVNLSVVDVYRFYCWCVTLRCALDLWPWPWTFVVYCLWRGDTLYQIWVKWDNPHRSYCDLNSWPCDLEHVSRVALCCGITCRKFKLSQPICLWNATIFDADTLCYAVTLTYDPLILKLCGKSGVTCHSL